MGKTKTTENSEMGIGCSFVEEEFIWGFVFEDGCRGSIDEVGGGKDTFPPIFDGEVGLKTKCPSNFKYMSMFPFYSPILFGSVNYRGMSNDAM